MILRPYIYLFVDALCLSFVFEFGSATLVDVYWWVDVVPEYVNVHVEDEEG